MNVHDTTFLGQPNCLLDLLIESFRHYERGRYERGCFEDTPAISPRNAGHVENAAAFSLLPLLAPLIFS